MLSPETLPEVLVGAPTVAGVTVGERAALQIVDVLACVRCLAETASTLPLAAYRRLPNESRQRLTSGRLYDLLEQPAPAVTQSNLIGQMVGSLALNGNTYVGKFRNADGVIEQIGALPTGAITVQIVCGEPFYRYYPTYPDTSGEQRVLTARDILHVKLPLTDELGVLGLSPIRQAREALGVAKGLGDEEGAMVANNSTPLGIGTVQPGPGADDLVENLKQGFEARHQGAANRGRMAFVTGEVTFSALSLSPVDAQWVERRQLSTVEIARLFRVPPWMIGARSGDSHTYSNVEGQSRSFLTFSLSPYLVSVEQAFTNDPDLCAGNVFVEFLRDAILTANTTERFAAYAVALGNGQTPGWMTVDEVRQRENLPPLNAPQVAE
jgi:HK97 family phage portal protein